MILVRYLFIVIATACLNDIALGQDMEPDPYKLVRTLQRAQDEIAQGSHGAYDLQRKLLDHIGNKFIRFPDIVWSDPKNSEAAAVFALAGGDPQVGKWLLEKRNILPKYKVLLEGAVAFASRNYEQASILLAESNPFDFPGHLGGSLALVKAMLVAKKDPKEAAKLFAKSKLLVPGTLIEEAALRRSLVLFKKKEDLPNLVTVSSSYYRQFGRSVFGPVFDDSLAKTVARFEDEDLEPYQEKLSEAVKLNPIGRQKKIYLMFAKNAVISGKVGFARFSSSNASMIAEGDPQSQARADLYLAAASIVTDEPQKALNALGAIDAKILSDDDKKIMMDAANIGTAIAQWPPAEEKRLQSKSKKMSEDTAASLDDLFIRIQPLMAEVDGILETLNQ